MHLNSHGVSHLSQLRNRGPTLLLKFPQYRHGPSPSPRAPHTVARDQHRRRADRRGAHHRRSHRHLPHHHHQQQQHQLPINKTLQTQIDSNLQTPSSSKAPSFPSRWKNQKTLVDLMRNCLDVQRFSCTCKRERGGNFDWKIGRISSDFLGKIR